MKSNSRIEKLEPALMVMHGNSEKKSFALPRIGMVLGRAPGCDILLDATDVSPVHCIISRSSKSLHVRDCSSRVGTRVNGQKITDSLLYNADIMQIGTFSFEVFIPWDRSPQDDQAVAQVQQRLLHLERSRSRLAERALSLRSRLQLAIAERNENAPPSNSQETETLWERLQEYERLGLEYEEREKIFKAQLAENERETANLRSVARNYESRSRQLEASERALAIREARMQTPDADTSKHETVGDRVRPLSGDRIRIDRSSSAKPGSANAPEESQALDKRREELDKLARQVSELQQQQRQEQQQLQQTSQELDRERLELKATIKAFEDRQSEEQVLFQQHLQDLEQERLDLDEAKNAFEAQPGETLPHLEQDRQDLASERAELDALRNAFEKQQSEEQQQIQQALEEFERERADLEVAKKALEDQQGVEVDLHQASLQLDHDRAELDALQKAFEEQQSEERQQIQQALEELERDRAEFEAAKQGLQAPTGSDDQPDYSALAAALAERRGGLERLVLEVERLAAEAQQHRQAELTVLRHTNEHFQQLATEERGFIDSLLGLSQQGTDSDALAKEMQDKLRQLEADRKLLDEEMLSLRTRSEELDRLAENTDLEASCERARLAHERSALELLRAELRQELALAQKTPILGEKLAQLEPSHFDVLGSTRSPSTATPFPGSTKRLDGLLG